MLATTFDLVSIARPSKTNTYTVDWNHYHNYTEIINALLDLNASYPNIVDTFLIGKSCENREIYCVRLTDENSKSPKPEVLFVGYHHGDERITAEIPFYFVIYTVTNYGSNATITNMLDSCEIYVVVAVNVDVLDIIGIHHWQRKNTRPTDEDKDGLFDEDPADDENGNGYVELLAKKDQDTVIRMEGKDDDGDGLFNEDAIGGVDLNRNYDYAWNETRDYDKGSAPFSEPETQAIRDLALKHNFKYALDFHSGGSPTIFYPRDVSAYSNDYPIFSEISYKISKLVGGASFKQAPHGGCMHNWLYANKSVIALAAETFANDSIIFSPLTRPGPTNDTYWWGGHLELRNPSLSHIEEVASQWLPTFIYIAERAIEEASTLPVDIVVPIAIAIGIVSLTVTIIIVVLLRRRRRLNFNPKPKVFVYRFIYILVHPCVLSF